MLPYLTEHHGNPSSIHAAGRRARQGLDEARERIAATLGAKPREIVFTAAAPRPTTSPSRASRGPASARGRHIVTSAVEHKAVLHAAAVLERHGFEVTYLAGGPIRPGRPGRVAASDHRAHDPGQRPCPPTTRSARSSRSPRSAPSAGSEASPSTPMRSRPPPSCRSTSTPGRRPAEPVGPQAGRPEGHRRALRAPGDAAAAAAVRAARRSGSGGRGPRTWPARSASRAAMRQRPTPRPRAEPRCATGSSPDSLAIDGVELTGPPDRAAAEQRLLLVEGVEGGDLVAALDLEGIEASTGSACTTGSAEPSHVLLAMGIERARPTASLRLTLGPGDERRRTSSARSRPCVACVGPAARLGVPADGGVGRMSADRGRHERRRGLIVAAALLAQERGRRRGHRRLDAHPRRPAARATSRAAAAARRTPPTTRAASPSCSASRSSSSTSSASSARR